MLKKLIEATEKAVLSGTHSTPQKIYEQETPRKSRKKLKKRIRAAEQWQLHRHTVYNIYGVPFDGIASWGRRICVRLEDHEYRFDILRLDRFGRRSYYLLPFGNTSKQLPGLDLGEGEFQLLIQMADEISGHKGKEERLVELRYPLRTGVNRRIARWSQCDLEPKLLLDLLKNVSVLLPVLTATLDSQLRTLRDLQTAPTNVYNFLLPKGDAIALDWLIIALRAVTFSNETSSLPGPIVARDLDTWRKGFRRLTLISTAGQSLLHSLIYELSTYDQIQKSGGSVLPKFPTIPITAGRNALCDPYVLDVELPAEAAPLSAVQQDILRTAMAQVLTKETARTVFKVWTKKMEQPTAYRLSGYAVWRNLLTRQMCRPWFPKGPLLSSAFALCEVTQRQQEAEEQERYDAIQRAYRKLTAPERYAGQIIDRPHSKEEAKIKLASEAFALRYDPISGHQQGKHFLAFNKTSLLRLMPV